LFIFLSCFGSRHSILALQRTPQQRVKQLPYGMCPSTTPTKRSRQEEKRGRIRVWVEKKKKYKRKKRQVEGQEEQAARRKKKKNCCWGAKLF